MSIVLRLAVDDRHGVLDRITGIIRRNGWNISSVNAGAIDNGYSNINIRLEDRGADVQKLGKSLSQLDCVQSWQVCTADTHVIREQLLLKIYEKDHSKLQHEQTHLLDREGDIIYIEYTGLPWEIDRILKEVQGYAIDCVRAGVVSMPKGSEANE